MFEAYTLREEDVKQQTEALRRKVESLSSEQRSRYFSQYSKLVKDPDTYATLNWFFLAGLHHFYLGNVLQGILNLGVMLIGVALCFVMPVIGASLIALIFLIELPALFRSQIISDYDNNQRGLHLVEQIIAGS